MKLSQLGTDKALDVLCEITPYVTNITSDEKMMEPFSSVIDSENTVRIKQFVMVVERYSTAIPILLKTHRPDIYGILSIVNERTVQEIATQKLIDTMKQVKELFEDEELVDFFKSFFPQAQVKQPPEKAESE